MTALPVTLLLAFLAPPVLNRGIDARGRPTRCRIAETNVRRGDLRFYMCNAFMGGAFETEPAMENGVAVPGTIERLVVLPGRNSRREHERARREHRARERAAD